MASFLRCWGGGKGSDASLLSGVLVGDRREPSVELEDRHAMRESPCGAGEVGVATNGLIDREGSAAFDAGREHVPLELAFSHQPVEVWMRLGKPAVGTGKRAERIVAVLDRVLERLGLELEAGRDDRRLERLLVRQMLVDRRGADAKAVG